METIEKSIATYNNKIEEQRFEFVLYVNDKNIICQRYFNIFDFNEDSLNSLELKEMMDTIGSMNNGPHYGLGIIPNYLKKKSMDYLWENYNPYKFEDIKTPPKKGDTFKFAFRVDKRTVSEIIFPNEFFTFNTRVSVDIREIIPAIMSEIRQVTSQKKYTIVKG